MPAWAKSAALRAAARLTGLAALCFSALLMSGPATAQTSDLVSQNALRVCADPANYPMSTKKGTGYENELAELIASKLDLPVQYTWYPQATGFIRNTLKVKRCDIVMGYAQGHELVLNTNHYFSSVYTLIVPQDSPLASVETLTDDALKGTRIGIIAGTPPRRISRATGSLARPSPTTSWSTAGTRTPPPTCSTTSRPAISTPPSSGVRWVDRWSKPSIPA